MTTATKTTVRDLLRSHGTQDLHAEGELCLDLVSFGRDGNYLRLIEQPDGRIDLVDCNCSDTDSDFSDDDVSVLKQHVADWLKCVRGDDLAGDDDSDLDIFPID